MQKSKLNQKQQIKKLNFLAELVNKKKDGNFFR